MGVAKNFIPIVPEKIIIQEGPKTRKAKAVAKNYPKCDSIETPSRNRPKPRSKGEKRRCSSENVT